MQPETSSPLFIFQTQSDPADAKGLVNETVNGAQPAVSLIVISNGSGV